MRLFCPDPIVWGDVASWVGALVTAVVAAVAVWPARKAVEVAKIPAHEAANALAAENNALAALIAPTIGSELRRAHADCSSVKDKLESPTIATCALWGQVGGQLVNLGIRPMKMCETHIDRMGIFGQQDGWKIAYAITSVLNLQAELADLISTANASRQTAIADKGRERLDFLVLELANVMQQLQSCREVLKPFGGSETPQAH